MKLHQPTKQTKLLIILSSLFTMSIQCYGQLAPAIDYRRVTWPSYGLSGYQTQDQSGEDWWYNHANAYDSQHKQIGYASVGYSSYVMRSQADVDAAIAKYNEGPLSNFNPITPGALSDYVDCGDRDYDGERRPIPKGVVALNDLNGNILWGKALSVAEMFGVATTDNAIYCAGYHSGFRTFGHGENGALLVYNPDMTNATNTFDASVYLSILDGGSTNGYGKTHAYLAKLDVTGNVVWQFLYGYEDFTPATAGDCAKTYSSQFKDIIVNSSGNIVAVGFGVNSDGLESPFVMEIDAATGYVIRKITIPFSTLGFTSFYNGELPNRGLGKCISQDPLGNYIIGADIGFPTDGHIEVAALILDNNLNLTSNYTQIQPDAPTYGANTVWDVVYNASLQKFIMPVIKNCTACRWEGDYGDATGNIYAIDNITAAALNIGTVGGVVAFDLRFGITNTYDGGFATVSSTRRINTNPTSDVTGPYLPPYTTPCPIFEQSAYQWDTDPLITKFSSTGAFQWEKTFDIEEGRPRENFPGDIKRQECMYSITQSDIDNGLVIAGNSSYNFDDYYMAKLYDDCAGSVAFTIQDPTDNQIDITSNTVWSSSQKVIGEVVIQPGVTLTISNNAVIEFADSKTTGIYTAITVLQGGHLNINGGAKLTSILSCPNAMWDGITSIGDYSQSQTTSAQGFVTISSSSTSPVIIENARIGILLGYNGNAHLLNHQGGGSWATCTNTVFKNNNIDVQTVPYISPTNSTLNKTKFVSCAFISDKLLNDQSYVNTLSNQRRTTLKHLYLNGVNGVYITNCTFKTDLTGSLGANYATEDRSYGIYSTDARFTLIGSSTATTSVFENLRYGVYATSTNTLNTYTAKYNTFKNCYSSIYQNNINYSNVTFNNFNVSNLMAFPLTPKCAVGVNESSCQNYFYYLNQCNGYTHQENNYTVAAGLNQKVFGTIFNASPGTSNLSYRNTYSNVDRGHQAQAGNSSLQIKCNFNSTVKTADIALTSQGIAIQQGNCGGSTNPAGNTFSHIGMPQSDIKLNAGATNFTYNYHAQPTSPGLQIPINYNCTVNGCLPTQVNNYSATNSCPTNYPTSNPCGAACRMANLDNISQQITNNQQLLVAGDDQSLITTINAGNEGHVQQALMNKSPYLSDRVLITFLQHSPSFAPGNIKNVITANSPVTVDVKTVLDAMKLPPGIKKQINDAQTGVSQRTIIEGQIDALFTQYYFNLHDALNQLLTGTDSTVQNPDAEIKLLLSNELKGEVIYKSDLVAHLVETSNLTDAESLNNTIKVLPGMANMGKVHKHKIDLKQADQTWLMMQSDAALKQDMQDIASDSTQLGFAAAGAAFTSVYETPGYEEIEDLITGSSARLASTNGDVENNTRVSNADGSFKAFPNPTTGYLTVNYTIDDPSCTNATLQLIEIATGRIVMKKDVSCASKQAQIDMNGFADGVYSLSIQSNLTTPKNIRIIKVQ